MKKKNNDKRQITTKNYVVLTIVFLVSLVVVFGLRRLYIDYQEYQLNVPVISGELNEIHEEELDTYITANENVLLYIGVSNDENCRAIEKDLKKVIKERHLKDKMVYLNLSDSKDLEKFYKNFNEKYVADYKIDSYPAFVVIRDGKVITYIAKNENKDLKIEDFIRLIDEFEIGDNSD